MERGLGGLQGGSLQTSKNVDFDQFRPFLGVCPKLGPFTRPLCIQRAFFLAHQRYAWHVKSNKNNIVLGYILFQYGAT